VKAFCVSPPVTPLILSKRALKSSGNQKQGSATPKNTKTQATHLPSKFGNHNLIYVPKGRLLTKGDKSNHNRRRHWTKRFPREIQKTKRTLHLPNQPKDTILFLQKQLEPKQPLPILHHQLTIHKTIQFPRLPQPPNSKSVRTNNHLRRGHAGKNRRAPQSAGYDSP
jgi:hypothetical protein